MGGEWGVGTSLVMEKVPSKWRGVLSGFLQEGYAAGYLLAAVAAFFMLDRFGWRPLFFLGGAPALLALFIRITVKESDVWQKTKAESWSHLGRRIASHWKLWIYLTFLMAMMNFSSHGTQDMYPTFMQQFRGLDPKVYSQVVIVMMSGAIVGGIAFGLASDRFGRQRMMIVALLGALAVVPLWAFSSSMGLIVVGCVSDAVHGAGGMGHHPRPHQRTVARSGARLPARLLLSVRQPHRGLHRMGSSGTGRATPLPARHGRQRGCDLRPGNRRDRAGPRASRYRIRVACGQNTPLSIKTFGDGSLNAAECRDFGQGSDAEQLVVR